MQNKKLYITTTIPYVNAAPHLGHALEFVQSDVLARYARNRGEEVYFLSGTDENALKNVQAAEQAGISVKELVDKNSELFRDLLKRLNVSIDGFIRTTEERHIKGAQALWQLTRKEDIYKKTYEGLYCTGCELFYTANELSPEGECFEHPGKKLEIVQEENYFFKLSNYSDWLKEFISEDKLKIIPETRKNELLSLIERGLEDFSVSRPVERSKNWGVPVPNDPAQTMYVWYDALANYITALGFPDQNSELYKKFWAENENRLHVLGKGVSRFHAIYWPAMLKSAGLPIPNLEFVHGYITIEGQKMSKTTGNVINPIEAIEKYGVDATRYYLLREIPAYDDGDFSFKKFELLYNGDLANGLGNFAARVTTMASQVGEIDRNEVRILPKVEEALEAAKTKYKEKFSEFKFNESILAVWELIHFGDEFINITKPWETKDKEIIFNLLVLLDNVAALILPFMPETASKITSAIKNTASGIQAEKLSGLFPRLASE